jgi:hypothetical protein
MDGVQDRVDRYALACPTSGGAGEFVCLLRDVIPIEHADGEFETYPRDGGDIPVYRVARQSSARDDVIDEVADKLSGDGSNVL